MEKTGNSRLLQMQARFQQKQMQEREIKIASLYEAQQARALDRVRHSPSNGVVNGTKGSPSKELIHPKLQESEIKIASLYEAQQARALDRVHNSPSNGSVNGRKASPLDVSINPGKVRQMFEERRTKGIDKSYPLQPIHNKDRQHQRKPLPNNFSKVAAKTNGVSRTTTNIRGLEKKVATTRTTVKKTQQHHVTKTDNMVNGAGDLNHNHEQDLHPVKDNLPQSHGEQIASIDELDRVENNYLLENETFPDALAPEPTPRSPEPKEPKRPPRRNTPNKNNQTKQSPQPVAPPRRAASDNAVPKNIKPHVLSAMQISSVKSSSTRGPAARPSPPRKTATTSASPAAPASPSAGGGEPCAVCGRRFAPDRLPRHQEICKKAGTKKRKPFDALKHRLAGTEAEPFINKLRRQGGTSSTKVSKPINSTWRQKHEEFINTIRAAKQVQAHLKAGGKLADLPPPPPSENPDYVQCPHCRRRFNQQAADRHIPKCASFQFNKPKAQPAKGRR